MNNNPFVISHSYTFFGGNVVRVFVHFFFHCRWSFSPWWPLAFLIFSPPLQNFHVVLPTKKMWSPVQTDATSLANNSQLCWMLHVAYVCTPCCMLLDVVACCCAKFETVQTSSYVQTDAITPNNVESCWPAVLHPHPFAHGFRLRANGRNNSQHCCANNVGSCCVRVGSGVQTDATTPNNFGTCSTSWEGYNP